MPNAVKEAGEMEILTHGVKALTNSNDGEHSVISKMRTACIPITYFWCLLLEGPLCAQGATERKVLCNILPHRQK